MRKYVVIGIAFLLILAGCAGDISPSPTPTPEPTPESELTYALEVEQEMHKEVNRIRASNGLNTLEHKEDLRDVARSHSEDMDRRDFFSHTNPDGESPFDRLENAGIQCYSAGENILYNYNSDMTPEQAAKKSIDQWMNSPGHRANILRDGYEEEGIGVHIADDGRLYATQKFCSR